MGKNPKLDLVNVDAHKKIGQILTICSQGIEQKQNSDVRFCPFILEILSGNKILTSIKGRHSVKILRKMMGNKPKLDRVNVDVHTKFGQILSICSQDTVQKRNSNVSQGP